MAKDGYKIKSMDALSSVAPFVMVNRNGSTNYFRDKIEISNAEKYIHKKRAEGLKGFGYLHLFIAAYIRVVAKYPGINRFIRGQRIFARKNIEVNMAIKKELKITAEETCIKAQYMPDATAEDVFYEFNKLVDEYKNTDNSSSFDKVANGLMKLPSVLFKFFIHTFKTMEYFGLLPNALKSVSPFHGSIFITSMGSLGIPPVFHHLYDFGNLPIFIAYGRKYREYQMNKKGEVEEKKYIDFTVSADERICDGHYYAVAFKYMRKILENPEILDNPPEEIVHDLK